MGESVSVGVGVVVVLGDHVTVPDRDGESREKVRSSVLLIVMVWERDMVIVRIVFDCSDDGLGVEECDPDTCCESDTDEDCDADLENDAVLEEEGNPNVSEMDCEVVTDFDSERSREKEGLILAVNVGEFDNVKDPENDSLCSGVGVTESEVDDDRVKD